MPTTKTIIPGDRFGRWTALERNERRSFPCGKDQIFHECRCDCGTIQMVGSYKLRTGHSRSCGCLLAEVTAKRSTTHGFAPRTRKRPKIYGVWCNMINRCTNPNVSRYQDYGGRGITVCERWLNSFDNFLEDMGEPSHGLTIDRLDNDKGYFKENCAWKNRTDQARNRRNTVNVTFNGETLSLPEWAERLGMNYRMIRARYCEHGWSAEETLTIPKGESRQFR